MVAQLAPHKFSIPTILVEEYTSKKIVLVLMIVFYLRMIVFYIITAREKGISVKGLSTSFSVSQALKDTKF